MKPTLRPLYHIAPSEEEDSVREHGLLSSEHLVHNREKYRELFERLDKRRDISTEELEAKIKTRIQSERWKNIYSGPNTFIDLPPDLFALSPSHPLRDNSVGRYLLRLHFTAPNLLTKIGSNGPQESLEK